MIEKQPLADSTKSVAGTGGVNKRTWRLVIRAQAGWFDLHLRDFWNYRDLVGMFVRRDFVAQFKQTILGPALIVYFLTDAPVRLTAYAWLAPVLVFIMAALALGLGIIFSSMTTKYRDLRFLLDFGVRLVMYAAPVVYPLSAMPDRWRWFLLINPMTPVIETFRLAFLGQGDFSWLHLSYSAGFAIFSLFFGIAIFNRVERTFMDTV